MKGLLLATILVLCCMGCEQASETGVGPVGATPADTAAPEATVATPGATVGPDAATTVSGREAARVTRVVDGDTIDVELNGEVVRVRYIGIDTPETVDPGSPVECFGPEATRENVSLVDGRVVELEKDVSETDRYGRLLRYVYIDGSMVNEKLVLGGYATSATFPPDVKYQERFARAEVVAREAGRGLWGSCVGNGPPTPAAGGCPEGCVSPPPECEIKGNINSAGVKIYHVPSGAFYDATVIDTLKGERWFCTPEEAVANGWRASQR